jgi:hypothetical protein
VKVTDGGTTLAAYGYDGLNRRITETHGSTTTDLYHSAQWQVLEERVGGQVQARNVWSPVHVDALVLRDQSSAGNGVLDQRLYVQHAALPSGTWPRSGRSEVDAGLWASGCSDPSRPVPCPFTCPRMETHDWPQQGQGFSSSLRS